MSDVPAGWYPDPDQSGRQRYWDGAQWTEHFDQPQPAPPPQMPAGWYPDPDVQGQQRYWDGGGWTDQVHVPPLFDRMVAIPYFAKRKEKHLRITNEEMEWDGETIRWAEVSWFTQLITVQNGAEAQFLIRITHGDLETPILLGRSSPMDRTPRHAYDAIIGQLRRTLGVRVTNGLLDMVDRGESVRTAGLLLSPEGFGKEGKGELVPWPQFGGLEIGGHQGIWAQFFQTQGDKRKKAVRVELTQLHSWALPSVVEAFSRRYG